MFTNRILQCKSFEQRIEPKIIIYVASGETWSLHWKMQGRVALVTPAATTPLIKLHWSGRTRKIEFRLAHPLTDEAPKSPQWFLGRRPGQESMQFSMQRVFLLF
jgi:hypothetical protein